MRALRFRLKLALGSARSWMGVPLRCESAASAEDLERRSSPLASLRFAVREKEALLCYGRPSARGREIFGDVVPYDELWRTGANEPTVLNLPFRAAVAGIRVRRGRYSLYTVPRREGDWTLVVNRATTQWGLTRPERGPRGNLFPNAYTDEVRSAEVARVAVQVRPVAHVEQLTARVEVEGVTTVLLVEWETSQIRIPVEAI